MKTWVKVVIGLLAFGFVGTVVVALGIYFWVSKNKDRLIAETKESVETGRTFGRTHKKNECVDQAFTKLGDCSVLDLVCETKNKMFLQSCLQTSAPELAFCIGVPKMSDILDAAQWSVKECARRGRVNDQPCTRLVQGLSAYCQTAH